MSEINLTLKKHYCGKCVIYDLKKSVKQKITNCDEIKEFYRDFRKNTTRLFVHILKKIFARTNGYIYIYIYIYINVDENVTEQKQHYSSHGISTTGLPYYDANQRII